MQSYILTHSCLKAVIFDNIVISAEGTILSVSAVVLCWAHVHTVLRKHMYTEKTSLNTEYWKCQEGFP